MILSLIIHDIFFYLSYLIETNRIEEAISISKNIDYINTTLLLSQAKSWIEDGNLKNLHTFFLVEITMI